MVALYIGGKYLNFEDTVSENENCYLTSRVLDMIEQIEQNKLKKHFDGGKLT